MSKNVIANSMLHPSVITCRAHCSFSRSEGRWRWTIKKKEKHPLDNADIDYTLTELLSTA